MSARPARVPAHITFSARLAPNNLDISLRSCTLSSAGEFSRGEWHVKKILITALLAATPLVALAAQEPQGTTAEPQSAPVTGTSASSSHHARRHHKRAKNSHHRTHHHTSKQHSQPQ